MRFSERYGYQSVRAIVQIDSVDEPLRNALWNLLQVYVWDHVQISRGIYGGRYLSDYGNEQVRTLCHRLWHNHFKKPLDQIGDDWTHVCRVLRNHFFECPWYEVYDFLEFVAHNYERREFSENFMGACNDIFEREVSAYRFVEGVICRITEEQEIQEIEDALDRASGPVRTHLRRSLELLASRDAPDYRNAIKESICAVESLVAQIVGAEKGTLGQLVKRLEDQVGLHPALGAAFSKLYGYTSDEGGIRHALLEAETVQFEDAKFFLVVCSAFVNFVEAKAKGDD